MDTCWGDCPVCKGRGFDWYDLGRDAPVKASCGACGGTGAGEWLCGDDNLAADTRAHDAPYDALAA